MQLRTAIGALEQVKCGTVSRLTRQNTFAERIAGVERSMVSQLRGSNYIHVGARVHILYSKYGVGRVGSVIAPEEEAAGLQTGYWLVQIEGTELILALLPNEIERL